MRQLQTQTMCRQLGHLHMQHCSSCPQRTVREVQQWLHLCSNDASDLPGARVDLAEVEAAASSHPVVVAAAARAWPTATGKPFAATSEMFSTSETFNVSCKLLPVFTLVYTFSVSAQSVVADTNERSRSACSDWQGLYTNCTPCRPAAGSVCRCQPCGGSSSSAIDRWGPELGGSRKLEAARHRGAAGALLRAAAAGRCAGGGGALHAGASAFPGWQA